VSKALLCIFENGTKRSGSCSGLQLAKQSLTLTVINKDFVRRRSGYQIRLDYLQKAFVGERLKNNRRYWCPETRPVSIVSSARGGGGKSTKFYTGRLRPEPPLPFLHAIFDRKGILFVYLLLTNGTPFSYLV